MNDTSKTREAGRLDRRRVLQLGVTLAGGAFASRLTAQPFTNPLRFSPSPQPLLDEELEFDLAALPGAFAIRPGPATQCWSYAGSVRRGSPGALQRIPGSPLGPILLLRPGQHVRIDLHNGLPEDHVTHWHGMDVPAHADGHPMDAFGPGQTKRYEFEVRNRAGTYWFHPHPHERTGFQVYKGLAGLMIVQDDEEQSLPLPRGPFDVPLVIQDATFDAQNQLVYNPDAMNGFFGSTVLINGVPSGTLSLASRVYRLRLLNGCQSRILKLRFSDQTPLVVIGTDGGLIDRPRVYPYVMLAPGERVELWLDLRGRPVGTRIALESLSFTGGGTGQGSAFEVVRLSVDRAATDALQLPATLSSITRYRLEDAVNAGNPRSFPISMVMPMRWVLNGAPFSMKGLAANEIVRADTLEVWQFSNPAGAGAVAHPIHVHGRLFQILDRTVASTRLADWNTVKDGYVDAGWKDTFMLMPGETVRLLVRHSRYTGMFVYHCHNLPHEDMGMMRNFRIDP
jgi:FtsP/CotA-like multicopper oxidase with cupredoxin domain